MQNPNDFEARFKKAYCHEILQDFDQAGEEYREIASRTQSECVRAVANDLARATDRDERSRSECTEALRLATRVYDGSSLAWHYLGKRLRLQGESKNAIDAFEKAAARNKNDNAPRVLFHITIKARIKADEGESQRTVQKESQNAVYGSSQLIRVSCYVGARWSCSLLSC